MHPSTKRGARLFVCSWAACLAGRRICMIEQLPRSYLAVFTRTIVLFGCVVSGAKCTHEATAPQGNQVRYVAGAMPNRYPPRSYRGLKTPTCVEKRPTQGASVCWQVPRPGGRQFAVVSSSCGIDDTGSVHCWKNGLGEDAPEGVFSTVFDNGWDACAAAVGGGVSCWGRAPWPRVSTSSIFVSLTIGSGATHRAETGDVHGWLRACGLTTDQNVECWTDGESGHGGPLLLKGAFAAVDMKPGTVILTRPNGELAELSGDTVTESPLDKGPFRASTSAAVSCQLLENGSIDCQGMPRRFNAPPPRLANVRALRSGWTHACSLAQDGDVHCWGESRPPPNIRFRSISQPDFWNSYCGIALDGEVYCWGRASQDRLTGD